MRSKRSILISVVVSMAVLGTIVSYVFGVASSATTSGKPSVTLLQAILTAVFAVTTSLSTFIRRHESARRRGDLSEEECALPVWMGWIHILHGAVIIALLVTGWRYAMLVLGVGFVLSLTPVLEIIGNMLLSPFGRSRPANTFFGVAYISLMNMIRVAEDQFFADVYFPVRNEYGSAKSHYYVRLYIGVLVCLHIMEIYQSGKMSIAGTSWEKMNPMQACESGVNAVFDMNNETFHTFPTYMKEHAEYFVRAMQDAVDKRNRPFLTAYAAADKQFADNISTIDHQCRVSIDTFAGVAHNITRQTCFDVVKKYTITSDY